MPDPEATNVLENLLKGAGVLLMSYAAYLIGGALFRNPERDFEELLGKEEFGKLLEGLNRHDSKLDPMEWAAGHSIEFLEYLVSLKTQIRNPDEILANVIEKYAFQTEAIEILIKHGANANPKTFWFINVSIWEAYYGSGDGISSQTITDIKDEMRFYSPLVPAIKFHQNSVVRLLVENGASLDQITPPPILSVNARTHYPYGDEVYFSQNFDLHKYALENHLLEYTLSGKTMLQIADHFHNKVVRDYIEMKLGNAPTLMEKHSEMRPIKPSPKDLRTNPCKDKPKNTDRRIRH